MNTKLLDPKTHGITLTEHGLKIKRLLSKEEWQAMMVDTRRVKSAYLSVLADLTAYGRKTFGDDVVNEALEQMEFEMGDAVKAETIALLTHDQRTKYSLSSEQAYIIGKCCADETARIQWSKLCLEHRLTAFELKKSIEASATSKSPIILREADIQEKSGHGEGIPSIQGVRFRFQQWQRQFKDPDDVLKLPAEERRTALEMLEPIVALAAKLEVSLREGM